MRFTIAALLCVVGVDFAAAQTCEPPAELDPLSLFRRMSFDLRGQPPTYEEYLRLEERLESEDSQTVFSAEIDRWISEGALKLRFVAITKICSGRVATPLAYPPNGFFFGALGFQVRAVAPFGFRLGLGATAGKSMPNAPTDYRPIFCRMGGQKRSAPGRPHRPVVDSETKVANVRMDFGRRVLFGSSRIGALAKRSEFARSKHRPLRRARRAIEPSIVGDPTPTKVLNVDADPRFVPVTPGQPGPRSSSNFGNSFYGLWTW